MKRFSFIVLLFVSSGISIQAQEKNISPSASTKSLEHILYVNVTNPLLFGKVGLAYSIRNPRMDYIMCFNYRYSAGILGTTIYFANTEYGMARPSDFESEVSGFDIGVQFRFRDPVLSKPYAKYVKDVEKRSPFYAGIQLDFVYANNNIIRNYLKFESWVMEPSVGPVVGWNLNAGPVYFNFNMGLALGLSFIDYKRMFISSSNQGNETVVIFKYDIGFLVGYKF